MQLMRTEVESPRFDDPDGRSFGVHMDDAVSDPARVLIVERDALVASQVREDLRSLGYRVVGIADGSEDALRMAVLHRPTLVLLQLAQEDELGAIEVAGRLLRELCAGVVFMTARANATTLRRAGAALPLGYLITPFERQELQSTVATALARHKAEQKTRDLSDGLDDVGLQLGPSHELVLRSIETIRLCDDVAPLRNRAGTTVGATVVFRARRAPMQSARTERPLQPLQNLGTLGELAGGVAHDFNNLLSVILGHASLCAGLAAPQSSQAGSLEQIMVAAERGVGLCNQLLAYAGKGECEIKPMDVNQCVEETVHLLRILIGGNAALELDLGAGLPSLLVDRSQIQRVIMNLVINAAEALETLPGQITVRTRLAWLNPQDMHELQIGRDLAAGAYVVVEVADTGRGMDSETLRHIFEPFFTTKVTGRGLGLAAVQGIVRGHKAALHVESEAGRGTSFHVLLPVAGGTSAWGDGDASGGDKMTS